MELGLQFLAGKNKEEIFLKDFWEKKIHLNKESIAHNLPFTIKDLENIFDRARLTSSDLRLSSVDLEIMPFQYCNENGSINIQKAIFFFNRGSTIIIRSVENFNPWLRKLCFSLKSDFGNIKNLFINLYLTPENSQGFFHHYDTEDVFILQIEGEKEWYLYDAPYPLPLEDQHFSMDKIKLDKQSLKKLLLKAGEVLYIPRGTIHEAKSQNTISCHLTISIVPYTWHDIVEGYFQEYSRENILLRTSIPSKISKQNLKEFLRKISLPNNQAIAKTIGHFKANYKAKMQTPFESDKIFLNRLRALDNFSIIRLKTDFYKGIIYSDQTVEIEVAATKILLPIEARSIPDYILKKKICQVKDIPTKYLLKDKLSIINRLVQDSFAEVVEILR